MNQRATTTTGSRWTEEELAEIEKIEREVLPVLRALAEKLLGPDWREKAADRPQVPNPAPRLSSSPINYHENLG
jgi:hypothetical protein